MNSALEDGACPWRRVATEPHSARGVRRPVRDHRPHDVGPDRRPGSRRSRGCETPEGVSSLNALRAEALLGTTSSIQLVNRALTGSPSPECLGPRPLYAVRW